MYGDLAPDSSAVRMRLTTVADVACETSLLSACGGAKDTPVLHSLVILPDSEGADQAPWDGSTTWMQPMLRRSNLWSPDRHHDSERPWPMPVARSAQRGRGEPRLGATAQQLTTT